MNDELRQLRDSLRCAHCASIFKGSDNQAHHVKYENATVYCSPACRHAAARNRLSTPVPNRGPCPTCNKSFFSRRAKIYCSLDCYVNSEQFASNRKRACEAAATPVAREKMAQKLRTGSTIQCLACGEEIYRKLRGTQKFCTPSCYRAYMAMRFDRWIANPEGMALPQCYDEFLDREELNCIVGGCNWRGAHLTLHVNQAHGVRGDEFKRAAGFNLSTGLIAKPLAQALQQRTRRGVALLDYSARQSNRSAHREQRDQVVYSSSESREHHRKAMALLREMQGPTRMCAGCGGHFQQRHLPGRQLYCTAECRDQSYAASAKRARLMGRNAGSKSKGNKKAADSAA